MTPAAADYLRVNERAIGDRDKLLALAAGIAGGDGRAEICRGDLEAARERLGGCVCST